MKPFIAFTLLLLAAGYLAVSGFAYVYRVQPMPSMTLAPKAPIPYLLLTYEDTCKNCGDSVSIGYGALHNLTEMVGTNDIVGYPIQYELVHKGDTNADAKDENEYITCIGYSSCSPETNPTPKEPK